MRKQVKAQSSSPYWKHVGLILTQSDAIYDGALSPLLPFFFASVVVIFRG